MKALAALLEQWRKDGSPKTAGEIDALTEPTRLEGKTIAARQAEWDKRLKRYDPHDLPRMVDALLPFGRRSAEYRLPLLHAKGRDPRLAAALSSWVETRPNGFQGQATDGFWKVVLQVLDEIADVRQLARLEAVLKQVEAGIGCHADTLLKAGLPPLLGRLRVLAATVDSPVVIEKPDANALFAAVYADPDADAPRAVLADLLASAGDPRGEFINLQLRPGKPPRRVRELIAAHGVEWTGSLAPAVRKEGLEYARGFVRACRLGATVAALDLTKSVELATVEALSVSTGASLPAEAFALMRSLKELRGHVYSVLASPVPLTRLVELEFEGACDSARLVECRAFPALEALRVASLLHGADRLPLWKAPFASTLTSVWLGSVFGSLSEWRAWMQSSPAQVKKVSVGVVGTGVRLTMRRVAEENFSAEVLANSHGDSMTDEAQASVDAAVDAAANQLAGAGLESCARVELAFRPNTRGAGFPGTDLPPSPAALARLKERLPFVTLVPSAAEW
ncbi:MAG: TIGR02996 domain-containing protein [Archangium sp.]|nr:TIGR02996 domain-containing protein [Archangium sp.]